MNSRSPLLASLFTLAAACTRTQTPATTPQLASAPPAAEPAPSAPPTASAAADASAPAAEAPPSAEQVLFPAALAEGQGVIFAPAGQTVTLTPAADAGAPVQLRDGERVRFLEELAGVGMSTGAASIEVRGVRGTVPNAAVVTEERLRRSPDGQWAVFTAIESCGDFCHSALWLVGPGHERRNLCGNEPCAGPDLAVAWKADHSAVAVGSYDLRVASLTSAEARTVENVLSPVFAPSGRLFARGAGTDDGVFEVPATGAPRRVFGAPGRAPQPAADAPRVVPAAPVLEQDGAVLCASFARGRRSVVQRATLEGRRAPGTGACATPAR